MTLRERRKALGLTQIQLAALASVPQPVIAMLEGKRHPMQAYLDKLTQTLDRLAA